MKNKIYTRDWLALKPYRKPVKTDNYYVGLSNDLFDTLAGEPKVHEMIDQLEMKMLACYITSYFEDIISECGIWSTFIKKHQAEYGKLLPFYDMKNYVEGEVNVQDVKFFIWYFFNIVQNDVFISPYRGFIESVALNVCKILDREYEFAPENKDLLQCYTIDADDADFYDVRHLSEILLLGTYLHMLDAGYVLSEEEMDIREELQQDENVELHVDLNKDKFVNQFRTKLMCLRGNEWAAELLGKEHPLYNDLYQLSIKIEGLFLYKGQDKKDIFIEHIATGKRFSMTKKSFDESAALKNEDDILFMGIVKWQGEWWFSGIYIPFDFDADLVLDERNSIESRQQVSFLDHEEHKTKEDLKRQYEAFLDFNDGSQIAFIPAESIQEFCQDYVEHQNKLLNLSDDEVKDVEKRIRRDGLFNTATTMPDLKPLSATDGLVFFNPNRGIEIALDLNSAFPMKMNEYYYEDESMPAVMQLLTSESTSPELVRYCLDNCKDKLPMFEHEIGKLYLENLDFLLRFWKRENYFSNPAITYVG